MMQIDIDVVLEYELCVGETVLLILEAAETDGQSIASASLEIPDATLQRIDGEGLVGQRVWAPETSPETPSQGADPWSGSGV